MTFERKRKRKLCWDAKIVEDFDGKDGITLELEEIVHY